MGKLLLSQGHKLALLYAPFEKPSVAPVLEQVYGSSAPANISTYACDITSATSVNEAFQAIENDPEVKGGGAFPWALVNSAGYVNLSKLEETDPEDIMRHYMINLYGPTLTGQAFARLFLAHKKAVGQDRPGRIVNISSQAAHVALDNHGAYCASKAGVLGLTRCQANEWGKHGITSNSVSPGPVWTALGKKAWADERVREEYQRNVPTGKFAEPEEVASIVDWLCKDESLNINGTDIRLDGGYTAR